MEYYLLDFEIDAIDNTSQELVHNLKRTNILRTEQIWK